MAFSPSPGFDDTSEGHFRGRGHDSLSMPVKTTDADAAGHLGALNEHALMPRSAIRVSLITWRTAETRPLSQITWRKTVAHQSPEDNCHPRLSPAIV